MIQIAPSMLSCDFSRLAEEAEDMRRCGADLLHLDVMDGVFVPNMSFGMPVIASLRKRTQMPFDVHLMIVRPERYIDRFIDAGADYISFHTEATEDVPAVLRHIRERGIKAVPAIKPATPIDVLFPYLDLCDMILVMTVEPGYGGQKLIPETLDKVRALRAELTRRGMNLPIEVDGGICRDTAKAAIEAGVSVMVAGSAVFGAPDRAGAIAYLKQPQ